MTGLLVHPSRGNLDGRVNLTRSLQVLVPFADTPLAESLTDEQLMRLLDRHPTGKARFWGTYASNEAKIKQIHEGDVVIFTGQGGGWAVGVVGYMFENPVFSELLWQETKGKGTYRHIYSLARFEEVRIPYAEINDPLGYKLTNHFQGMAVYPDEARATAVIDALHLDLGQTSDLAYAASDQRLAEELAGEAASLDWDAGWGGAGKVGWMVPIEDVHNPETTYSVAAADRMVRRGEGLLVRAFASTLPIDVEYGRHRTAAGITDLWIAHPSGPELVEAKSDAAHKFARQALAQLLDYAPTCPEPPTVVSALFPRRPQAASVDLLHRYGVDCIYRTGTRRFERLTAPASSRQRIRQLWNVSHL